MKEQIILILLAILALPSLNSQDTFSIVAVDSVTAEVGSAGASCVDLFQVGISNPDFLGQLVPNVGAINTQAYYIGANQENATRRMEMGDTPDQIINWLVANDIQSLPQYRQYGIAAFVNSSTKSAAYTGSATDSYKSQILGPNYAIQGNILLGPEVLESMENRFLNEPGDLACKLMAALQGANIKGADSRCSANGTSSLFAYVKVAQATDSFGQPSLNVSVRTSDNSGIEPIDSLQIMFDLIHNCTSLAITETEEFDKYFSAYPNPVSDQLVINNKTGEIFDLFLIDLQGKLIYKDYIINTKRLDFLPFENGSYYLKMSNDKKTFVKKIIIQ